MALLAKTAEPHPKLEGTIFTAAEQIEAAGGKALPIVGDVRDDEMVESAVAKTVEAFGGIDICLNNASAIDLSRTPDIRMKSYDLMQDINCRGTFLLSKSCIPHLREAENPHILTLSPPINLNPRWAGGNLAYAIAKYGMSLVTLGLAEELKEDGIAANSLWPRTIIATAAVQNLLGGDEAMRALALPRDHGRRRRRDPRPAEPRGHRQLLPRRRGPRRGGHHRPLALRPRRQHRPPARHLPRRLTARAGREAPQRR